MRNPAGYEAPYVIGAHLTRPITLPQLSASSATVPFPGGVLSLAVAQDYWLRFARRISRRVRVASASGTPETAAAPGGSTRPADSLIRTPPI